MSKLYLLFTTCTILLFASCMQVKERQDEQQRVEEDSTTVAGNPYTTVAESADSALILLFPQFTSIDMVCDTMPSQANQSVILCAAACFTGECLMEFRHSNIAGDHVSNGVRYKGYRCKRNTGAFVYYNGTARFLHQDYSHAMDEAASHGGCAFTQEMILHEGHKVESTRKDGNKNQFRALCQIDGRICIAESKGIVAYGDFKQMLIRAGADEALYLDMGTGWSHAWYRTNDGTTVELHPKLHGFCTNWITFYANH